MHVLSIIPARGGSKGIKGKNMKILCGKPLVHYSIDISKKIEKILTTVVSTDSGEINDYAVSQGCKVIHRPAELSTDTSLVSETIEHTLKYLEKVNGKLIYDIFLILEPTSPLRTEKIILDCLDFFNYKGTNSVATVSETEIPVSRAWIFGNNNKFEPAVKGANPWLPRQSHEKSYRLNGLTYASRVSSFLQREQKDMVITPDFIPVVTSADISVDIDTINDFNYVEYLMSKANEA